MKQKESYVIHYSLGGVRHTTEIYASIRPSALTASECHDFLVRSLKSEINYNSADGLMTDVVIDGIDN